MDTSANTQYTREQKAEMFDYVNNTFFKLKGDKRKQLRMAILSWKQNKQIGAFEMFVMLNNCEDTYDQMNESFQQYIEDYGLTANQIKNKNNIPYAKHVRRMKYKDDEIEALENEIESLKEQEGLIKLEDHKQEIKDMKERHKFELEEKDDKIKQLEAQIKLFDSRMKAKDNTHAVIVKNYETQIKSLTNELKE